MSEINPAVPMVNKQPVEVEALNTEVFSSAITDTKYYGAEVGKVPEPVGDFNGSHTDAEIRGEVVPTYIYGAEGQAGAWTDTPSKGLDYPENK